MSEPDYLQLLHELPVSDLVISPETVGDDRANNQNSHKFSLSPVSLSITSHQAKELRRCALRAAYVGVKNQPTVHYTETALRWEGITDRRRSVLGQAPSYADCSSFYDWCYWDGKQWLKLGDFINGAHDLAGYTGTMVQNGKLVTVDEMQPGDAVFYGAGIPYHVAMSIGRGLVISHGRESGPEIVGMGTPSQIRSYV